MFFDGRCLSGPHAGAVALLGAAVPARSAAGVTQPSSLSTGSRAGASGIQLSFSHWMVTVAHAGSMRLVRGTLYDRPQPPAAVTFIAFERLDPERCWTPARRSSTIRPARVRAPRPVNNDLEESR
jgi:hypothetical protein